MDGVQVQDERGLAGAVRTEERDPLPRRDREIDAEQRLGAVGVGERQAGDLERGGVGHRVPQAATQIASATAGTQHAASHIAGLAAVDTNAGISPV